MDQSSALKVLGDRFGDIAIEARRSWNLWVRVPDGTEIEMADPPEAGDWRVEIRRGDYQVTARNVNTTECLARLLESFDSLVEGQRIAVEAAVHNDLFRYLLASQFYSKEEIDAARASLADRGDPER